MPVTATPAGNPGGCTDYPVLPGGKPPTPTSVPCAGQHIIATNNPKESVTGVTLLTKTRAFNIKGKQKATLRYTLRDVSGSPVDLRECLCLPTTSSSSSLSADDAPVSSSSSEAACPNYIEFRLQEYLTRGGCDPIYIKVIREATIVDAENGVVEVELTPDDTSVPGVYFGQFALVERAESEDVDPVVLFTNSFYVYIGRDLYTGNLTGDGGSRLGPPSISEIRMHLRDTEPSESFLLDNLKFDDAEIAQAIYLPVEEWNEMPPPIGTYSTSSFPFRYHWLMAIAGHLFLVVAEHQRANNLAYSASGVSVNDMNKAPDYEQAAARRLQQWREWMRRKKAEINLSNAYGGIGSRYGYGRRGGGW